MSDCEDYEEEDPAVKMRRIYKKMITEEARESTRESERKYRDDVENELRSQSKKKTKMDGKSKEKP